jgi:selenium metabolism protein YedF
MELLGGNIMTDILTVDARGLACPQPVLETKKVLDETGSSVLRVLVQGYTSRENVSRFARNRGCEVEVQEQGKDEFEITLRRTGTEIAHDEQEDLLPCPVPEQSQGAKIVVYVGNNCMGRGDDELGQKLMRGFLRTWIDVSPRPWRMLFINSGVKLTTIDEEGAEAISMLEEKGVEILSCGTCLQHFGIEDKLRVGKVTNMFEIIDSLNAAAKVISPD